jgi:heat shock protein HslJ
MSELSSEAARSGPIRARRAGLRRGVRAAIALAVTAGVVGLVPGLTSPASAKPAPPPQPCSTVDFEKATVEAVDGGNRLTVSGSVPSSNIKVTLEPLVYIQQPEFWGIEVIGCTVGDIGLPVVTPYTATFDFQGSLGTCGIEVIGASRTQKFDLAGCSKPKSPLAGTRWTLVPLSLGVPLPPGRTITANFSDTTVSGSASCNLYSATYRTGTRGEIVITDIITTLIACDPATGAAEAQYLKKLANVNRFFVGSGRLLLTGPAGSLLYNSAPSV